MKRYVLIGLTLMIACFLCGGFYIVNSFHSSTTDLKTLAELSKVEFMRDALEQEVEVTQAALLLQATPHADLDLDAALEHVEHLDHSASVCMECHHDPITTQRLESMLLHLSHYMKLYGHALTARADSVRGKESRENAYRSGTKLLEEVKSLSVASADKISLRVAGIQHDLVETKRFLIGCLILGPLAVLLITLFFNRRFAGSVAVLVSAAEDLRNGDLERTIKEPLKDEFGILADSFNQMVASLNIERRNFLSINSLYQALFESAGDGICILATGDRLGEIVSVNPAICRMYGYDASEMLGMSCLNLSPPQEQEKFCQKMQQILQGEWISCNIGRVCKDGSEFVADISAGPLEINQEQYILTLTRDVTEKLKTQQELQRANQMAIVGQMAAGLAHEIKNPLAGIKVSLEVIADDLDLSDEDKEVFTRVLCEIDRMERLLKSLLNYARPPVPHFDMIDLNRILEHAMKNVTVTVGRDPDRKLEFETDLSELPLVEADSSQLQQVFLNIYLNAVDAVSEKGKVTTLTRMEQPESVRIEITDTGKGLSEEMVSKIFNPFFTTKSKGSGLGLAICKRLIEQHHGTIEVHSKVGEETSFVIHLPVSQQDRE